MAPAAGFAASLALTVVTFTHPAAQPSRLNAAELMAAAGQAALLEVDPNNNRNLWQQATFEWTKRNVSNSTTASFIVPGTNTLIY